MITAGTRIECGVGLSSYAVALRQALGWVSLGAWLSSWPTQIQIRQRGVVSYGRYFKSPKAPTRGMSNEIDYRAHTTSLVTNRYIINAASPVGGSVT